MHHLNGAFSGQACTCVRPTAQPSALATSATEDPVQTMPSDVYYCFR